MKPPLSPDYFSEMAATPQGAIAPESKISRVGSNGQAKEAVAFQASRKIGVEFAE
jgi:hypothetical protein